MENMMLLVLGICISVLGIVNIRGNISTIHSYNRRKVKEEDVPNTGKRSAQEHSLWEYLLCWHI